MIASSIPPVLWEMTVSKRSGWSCISSGTMIFIFHDSNTLHSIQHLVGYILSNICWWSWRTLKAICTQPSSNPPGLALDTVVTLVCAVPRTHSDFPESSPCISAPSHHIPYPFQLIKSYYSSAQIHHSVEGLGSRLASLKLERWFGA